jgi:hypothetical protein
MQLTAREIRMAWGFLAGVTVSEFIAIVWAFQFKGGWVEALFKYLSTPIGTLWAWLMAAAVTGAYVAYSATRSPVIREYAFRPTAWAPFWALRLFAIPMAFVTGFFEEAFFRKSVMDMAARHGDGDLEQILISAVVFGLAHAIWGVFGGKVRAALAVMLATTTLGALLALVYLAGNRSVGPCVAAHIGLNLFLEPWLVISSATLSWGKRSLRA